MGRGSSKLGGSGSSSAGTGEKGLTENQKEALDYYKQDGYYINNILRNEDSLDSREKEYVKALDEATSTPIQQDTLYRVVDASTVFPGIDDFGYQDLRAHVLFGDDAYDRGAYSQSKKARMQKMVDSCIGKSTTDKGFMSTTTDEDTAFHKTGDATHGTNHVVLKLTGTKGAKGADMGFLDKKYDYLTPEKEMLLSRGNGYTYKKVYAKNGSIVIEAEFKRRK